MMVQKLLKQAGALIPLYALLFCPFGNVYAQDNQATEILQAMSAEIASAGVPGNHGYLYCSRSGAGGKCGRRV